MTVSEETAPDWRLTGFSPFITSGLRVGTAAETTAGLQENEFAAVAALMARALRAREDESAIVQVRADVAELCSTFNPYASFSK